MDVCATLSTTLHCLSRAEVNAVQSSPALAGALSRASLIVWQLSTAPGASARSKRISHMRHYTHRHTHGHACDVRRSLWHLGVTKQVAKNSMSRRGHLVFIHLLQLPLSLSIYLSQGSSSTHHPLRIRGVGPG